MTGDRWIAVINVAASHWADTIGRACWQGGLALAVVWLLCCALPKLTPEIRCWFWRLAYAKLLVTFLWVSPVEVPLLPAQPPVQGIRGGTPAAEFLEPSAGRAGVQTPLRAGAAPGVNTAAVLIGVWLLGVVTTCAWLGGEVQWARSLLRRCVPVREDAWNVCCAELSRRLGLSRTPRLLAVAGDGSPLVVGMVRPAVILPSSLLAECSAAEVRLILAHELAHLKRRDLLWGWLPALTHAVFWFHPLVWLANSEWRTAQEIACDALAVRATQAPVGDYGDVLVKVARRDGGLHSGLTALGVNGSAGTLTRRLTAMKNIRQVSRKRLMLAGVVLATLGVPVLVSWRAVAQPAQDSPAGATIKPLLSIQEAQRRVGFPIGVPASLPEGTVLQGALVAEPIERGAAAASNAKRRQSPQSAGKPITKFRGLGVGLKKVRNAVIVHVLPSSPAEKAGIQVGDEIVAIGESSVDRLPLNEVLRLLRKKQKHRLRITNLGRERTVDLDPVEFQLRRTPDSPKPRVALLYEIRGRKFVLSQYEIPVGTTMNWAGTEMRKLPLQGTEASLRTITGHLAVTWTKSNILYDLSNYQDALSADELTAVARSIPGLKGDRQ